MSRRSRLLPRFLLASVFAVGCAVVGPVVFGVPLLFVAVALVITGPETLSDDRALVGYSDDGQPVLGQLVPAGSDDVTLAYFDLAGNPIKTQPWFAIEMPGVAAPAEPWRDRLVGWGGSTVDGTGTGPWYLVAGDTADGYLVEYAGDTGEPTRFLGSAGLRHEPISSQEYFRNLRWVGYKAPPVSLALLNGDTQLYLVDLVKAETRTLLADLKSPLRGLPEQYDYERSYVVVSKLAIPRNMGFELKTPEISLGSSRITDGGRSMPGDVILCNNELLFAIRFDEFHDGTFTTKTFPLPPAVAGRRFLFALRTGGGLTVAIPELPQFGAGTGVQQIYLVEPDGTSGPPRRVELPADPPEERERPWQVGLIFASPLAQAIEIATSGTRSWRDYAGMNGPWDYGLQLLWRDRRLMIWTGLVGAVLALACLRRQRRYCQPLQEQILWPVFVLVLGLPGWIGYRYSRRWPALEACETCRVASPRDNDVCAVCDHEFPLPTVHGTEIFA